MLVAEAYMGWVETVVTLRFCTCASYETILLIWTEEERLIKCRAVFYQGHGHIYN